MADSDRGIPTGLNRIRAHRVPPEDQSSSGGDDPPAVAHGTGKGLRKGKKIARWFSSHLSPKDSYKASDKVPPNAESRMSEVKLASKKDRWGAMGLKPLQGTKSMPESSLIKRKTIEQKSFSHELGPRGGIRPLSIRARSYSDLKELLGSLHSKFDAVKEAVNTELAAFAGDVIDGQENGSLSKATETSEYLLYLSQQCIEMTSSQFRENCEGIVQKLAERRQQCQVGLVKQLSTRMLFILTRCTRLLQFQKDSGTISEDSLVRFKQCLENVPDVDMNWIHRIKKDDLSSNSTVEKNSVSVSSLEGDEINQSTENILRSDVCISSSPGNKGFLPSKNEDALPYIHQIDFGIPKDLFRESSFDSLYEQEDLPDGVDSVICRICEENVPTSHLESHSYICAYADKCDLEGLDLDERLLNIAEILEQIVESYNQSFQASTSSPENSRMHSTNSVHGSEGHSPRLQEWHNKGMEGMFEDIHEMDTACIDDPQVAASNNLKCLLAMKIAASHPASSNGSMTPTSTPRSNNFDLFWLEHNNPSEPEDMSQMNELSDLARRVANTELSDEGTSDYLGTCLHDLIDILQRSQQKALVIDTFGSRIKYLLKEKYLLAVESEHKSRSKDMGEFDKKGNAVANPSQSTSLAPGRTSLKEKTSIDDFDIIKPISRGAFGKVFLARKRTTGDLFAIKVLKKLGMIRKNDIERILAERNILITVRNPFVVRFFYSFTCRDNLYLVMEYLNGGDLYSMLRKVGCLEEDVARIYIAELVLALEYLHSLGITHRDLKPDNILIARDGHIKLTDFGLSKIGLIDSAIDLSGSDSAGSILLNTQNQHVVSEHAHQRETRSRDSAVGTPDYLAPEILLGNAHGFAADWWSVGIILFEFITGIPPFTARLPEMIFENILNRKIPWPCVPDDMSYEAKDLIDRFLNQDQDLRLGANGASEVKAHPFFKEINWDNLALQKAAFIPQPDSADDTSYFMSRHSSNSLQISVDENSSSFASDATKSSSHAGTETKMGEYSELKEFDSCASLDLSSLNFSFKNLSQLASMNYDALLQSGKSSKCSSPSQQDRSS
ncbi:putative serine/threonine protein kinase IRE4 isoform X1 [Iris pallida]|uniref:non-specific serine/threonine protein kinase n=1 Tax=Iris pallida TaxID=29817 RepID=A0AAX6FAI6_IRIPA|nr:putative serine/threonine protein kinase IRE4 isoform X1 [Iris pallida]